MVNVKRINFKYKKCKWPSKAILNGLPERYLE